VIARRLLLLSLALASACGGERPGPDSGFVPPTDAGARLDADDSPPPLPAAGPGGGGMFDDDFFPLADGLSWEWRATLVSGSPGSECDDSGTHTSRITEVREESGGTVYVREDTPGCYGDTTEYRVHAGGVDVYNGEWYRLLSLPPELGATWAAGGASGATYEWTERHETYTVAAGTFSDCWTRSQQGYDVWEVYCPGAGMVESHYAAWGGDSRMELVSKSF